MFARSIISMSLTFISKATHFSRHSLLRFPQLREKKLSRDNSLSRRKSVPLHLSSRRLGNNHGDDVLCLAVFIELTICSTLNSGVSVDEERKREHEVCRY